MPRRQLALIVLSMVLPRVAVADAKSDALAAVGTAVAAIEPKAPRYREDHGFSMHAGVVKPQDMLDAAYACLKAVIAARNAGATGADTVTVATRKSGARDSVIKWKLTETADQRVYTTNVFEARTYCFDIAQMSSLDEVRSFLYYSDGWLASLTKYDQAGFSPGAETALRNAKACLEKWDAADAYGNKPTAELKLGKRSITLGDVKPKLCEPLKAGAEKELARIAAARDAAMVPFRKALAGDKLEVWEEQFGLEAHAAGKGGTDIETPQEYAAASLWFAGFSSDDSGCPSGKRYTLRRYQFKGNTLAGKPTESTGCGEAPASAYR
jgi:hypothetical protein